MRCCLHVGAVATDDSLGHFEFVLAQLTRLFNKKMQTSTPSAERFKIHLYIYIYIIYIIMKLKNMSIQEQNWRSSQYRLNNTALTCQMHIILDANEEAASVPPVSRMVMMTIILPPWPSHCASPPPDSKHPHILHIAFQLKIHDLLAKTSSRP